MFSWRTAGFISKNYLTESSSKSDDAIKNLYEIFEDDFFGDSKE